MTGREPTIALVGNPNVGKSTLFNRITGARQRAVNAPGTTVQVATGHWRAVGARVLDLPGTYSLIATSPDEQVVTDTVSGAPGSVTDPNAGLGVDLILVILDGSSMTRSLYLLAQVAQTGRPAVAVVTMADVAEQNGEPVNVNALAKKLGIPVMAFDPRSGRDSAVLEQMIATALVTRPRVNGIVPDPNAPELLLPILSKAMDPDPTHRYRNGTELTEALGQIREALGTGNLAVRGPVTSLRLVEAGLAPPPRSEEAGSPSSYAPSSASQWAASDSVFPVRPTGSSGSAASAPSIVSGGLEHSDKALLNAPVSAQRSQSLRLSGRERRRITLRSAAVGAVAGLVVGLGAGWVAGARLAPAASATGPSGAVSQPSSSSQDNPSTPPHPVGTCLAGTTSISGQTTARKVSCNEPHSWEVYQVGTLAESTSGSSDDDLAADPNVQATCTAQAAQQYGAADPSTSVLGPGEAGWNAGKRGFSCIASDKDGQRTSSYAG